MNTHHKHDLNMTFHCALSTANKDCKEGCTQNGRAATLHTSDSKPHQYSIWYTILKIVTKDLALGSTPSYFFNKLFHKLENIMTNVAQIQ